MGYNYCPRWERDIGCRLPVTKWLAHWRPRRSSRHQLVHLIEKLLQVLIRDLVLYRGDQRLGLLGRLAAERSCYLTC